LTKHPNHDKILKINILWNFNAHAQFYHVNMIKRHTRQKGRYAMFTMNCLGTNEKGNLTIGGADVPALAQQYGTPLYIMDETQIRENCRSYKTAIDACYDDGLVLYASKALSCKYIYEIVKSEGLGIDVVSGGELYTALQAGFPTDKIYFHGNNKTADELQMAVENNVGNIVVDNIFELNALNQIAVKNNKIVNISFRIKPGIDAHTHDFVMTGQIDSKFGVALETGEAAEIVRYATGLPGVNVVGVHCHIGSQIFDIAPFAAAAETMMGFIVDLKNKYGVAIHELNLGGGYGIKYTDSDDPVPNGEYIAKISEIVKRIAAEADIPLPKILMEPGRSIAAPAGITVYTVGAVKEIPNTRTYVSIDGGMIDNPRYILYQSKYDVLLPERPLAKPTQTVTIAGRCCESGDLIAKDAGLPDVAPGDYLAVLSTGAYNYSMASNYNRIPRPPIVMVSGGKAKVAVRRESYEDLVRNDL
jgi:diaminopimelate decarboxylase